MEPVTRKERILSGEDIEPITRLEYFLKEAAGGGSSLPPYTSADKGKVLTIGEASPVETVIVPEQTGEFLADYGLGYGFELTDPDLAFFASANEGDTCSAVIDGNEYTLTYDEIQSGIYGFMYSETYALIPIFVGDTVDGVMFVSSTASSGDTATISATASVPSVEPKWDNVFPPLPTANGNYILTISNGAASWTRQYT